MKWLKIIKKEKLMLGKRRLRLSRPNVKKIKLKLEAPTMEVIQRAFNNFSKLTVKHLFLIELQA